MSRLSQPENILVCSGDVAKLADMGIAAAITTSVGRHTQAGTQLYFSPEKLGVGPTPTRMTSGPWVSARTLHGII